MEKRFREPAIALSCIFGSGIILLIDLTLPLGVAAGIPYIIPVFFSLFAAEKRIVWIVAGLGVALTFLGYFYSPVGKTLWMVIFNRLLAILGIGATTFFGLRYRAIQAEKIELLRQREEEARREVSDLKSLLPICASCKSVRDDQGYWNQVESYISTRTALEFTHGLCPECVVQLYPEVAETVLESQTSY